MAELLIATDMSVRPDYHMFGIHASGGSEDEEKAPVPAPGWLGVGSHSFMIGVGEDCLRPELSVELWNGPPPQGPDDHEVQDTIRMQVPDGVLHLNQITMGSVSDIFSMRPGAYMVRITGWERESTRQAFSELLGLCDDWDDPRYEIARLGLDGRERYLLQFWRDWPAATLIESSSLALPAGCERFVIADPALTRDRPVPEAGRAWVAADSTGVLMRLGRPGDEAFLRVEVWDGPPPEPEDGHRIQVTVPMSVPSGELDVLRLPLGEPGRLSGAFRLPAGDFHVRVTGYAEEYVAQFWPAG